MVLETDEALVRAIRGGEIAAFDRLYDRYHRRLYSYLLRMCRDRAAAEDLLQEVFIEVLDDRAFELREGKFGGWLFTVARRRCLDHLRKSERRSAALGGLDPRAPIPTPEEQAEKKSRLEALADALCELSEPHQDALLLKEVAGLTYQQIAAIQSVPEGTAKSRLHFAIRALRRALGVGGDRDEL
jgi:RNA polymerase sigma-70 factor (ECF subfamily)